MIAGRFFDGERSTAQPARIALEAPDRVRLEVGGDVCGTVGGETRGEVGDAPGFAPRAWSGPLAAVEISDRIGNVPRRVSIPGVGVFETLENDAVDRALAALGRPSGLVPWLEARWPVAIAALVAVAVGSVVFVRFGVPAIADLAARTLPVAVDRAIGARTLELLDDHLLHPSELEPARQAELRERFAGMIAAPAAPADPAAATDPAADPLSASGSRNAEAPRFEERLELRAAPALGPNALALPSGIIVMTDELVGLAESDDELVAVLAHELGHVHGRHALRRLFQSASVSALAFALVGDISSASALFSAVPALIDAKHSRDFEREADGFAKAWLVGHGIPPERFDAILCRMERGGAAGGSDAEGGGEGERAESGRWSGYLSTHPATDERARCAASDARVDPATEPRADPPIDPPASE